MEIGNWIKKTINGSRCYSDSRPTSIIRLSSNVWQIVYADEVEDYLGALRFRKRPMSM